MNLSQAQPGLRRGFSEAKRGFVGVYARVLKHVKTKKMAAAMGRSDRVFIVVRCVCGAKIFFSTLPEVGTSLH